MAQAKKKKSVDKKATHKSTDKQIARKKPTHKADKLMKKVEKQIEYKHEAEAMNTSASHLDELVDGETLDSTDDGYTQELPKRRGLKVNKNYLVFTAVLAGLAILVYMFRNELVVARVNGEVVTRWQLVGELEKQYKKQTLENIVTKMLIAQEANKQGVAVTPEEVDAEIQTISANIESQGQDFNKLLEMQGFTMDSLKEDIHLQLLLEKLAGGKKEVTKEDIEAYVTANVDYFPAEMTDQEKQDAAVEQLEKRNDQEAVTTLLNELKGSADIQYGN